MLIFWSYPLAGPMVVIVSWAVGEITLLRDINGPAVVIYKIT